MADESTLFDWSTEPPPPLLSTRTGAFSLLAPCWRASEKAPAPCSLLASWPIAWMPVRAAAARGSALGLVGVLLRQVAVQRRSRSSRRCSTGRRRRHRPCCPRAPVCSRSRRRTAAQPRAPARPARSWPPGRSPACRSRTAPDRRSARSGSGCRPWPTRRRRSTARPSRRRRSCRRARECSCSRSSRSRTGRDRRTGRPATQHLPTGRSWPPARLPGCRRTRSGSRRRPAPDRPSDRSG